MIAQARLFRFGHGALFHESDAQVDDRDGILGLPCIDEGASALKMYCPHTFQCHRPIADPVASFLPRPTPQSTSNPSSRPLSWGFIWMLRMYTFDYFHIFQTTGAADAKGAAQQSVGSYR